MTVADNRERKRFELVVDGQTAFLAYHRTPGVLTLIHTEVPESLRGHQLGDVLVKAALDAARAEGVRVNPLCPFVKAYLRKHPDAA